MRSIHRPFDRARAALNAAHVRFPVELDPVDIAPHRAGNTGIDYVTSVAGAAPGPHVVLLGLVHGNEICGAIALDRLMRRGLVPARGTLTFAFANVAAYRNFTRVDPSLSRYVDEDFNRVWDESVLDGPRASRELARARALRPVIDGADYLLDIHSMTSRSAPVMLTGIEEKHLMFARRVGTPALMVRDAGHGSGRRLRDYGRFADPASPAVALLVECGQHWAKSSAEIATETAWRFLAATGILAASDAAPWLDAPHPDQRTILVTHRITIATDSFTFVENYEGLEIIPRAGTLIATDGAAEIRTPYDNCALIMPARWLAPGQTAVRLGRFED